MAEFVAGKGTTALGIIGTVLGSLGVAGNNGLLGWNNVGGHCAGNCSENMPVNRYELGQEQTIARLQADVALRDANIYNDQKLLEVYKYVDGELKDIRATVAANDKAQAIKNVQIDGAFAVLGEKLAREHDERCCADNSIITYLNATFYPKMVADITTGTTTTAQPTYNPLPNCGCGCR